jgi:hypothetical protein
VPNPAALGRYWMEHPMYWGGDALITNPGAIAWDGDGEAFLCPSPQAMAARMAGHYAALQRRVAA